MKKLSTSMLHTRSYILERGNSHLVSHAELIAAGHVDVVDWFSILNINNVPHVSVLLKDGSVALVTRNIDQGCGVYYLDTKVVSSDEEEFHQAVFAYVKSALSNGETVVTCEGFNVSHTEFGVQVG